MSERGVTVTYFEGTKRTYSRGHIRRAGTALFYFDATWDQQYLSRFGTGDVISDLAPLGQMEPFELGSAFLSLAEELDD